MSNLIENTLTKIESLLNIDPKELKKGKKVGMETCEESEKLKKLIFEESKKKEYEKIFSKVKSHSAKLSRDLLNAGKGILGKDWKQLAKQDLSKLKDEVTALQEFIKRHETILRKRLNRKKYGVDIRDLVLRLKKEESIDELTQTRLLNLTEEMEEKELQKKAKKLGERIDHIEKWLLVIKEVENIGEQ